MVLYDLQHRVISRSFILSGCTAPCWALVAFFSFIILYTVGRTPWTGNQPVARPLPTHRTAQTQTYMPRVGLEATTPAFERVKTVHALDRAIHRDRSPGFIHNQQSSISPDLQHCGLPPYPVTVLQADEMWNVTLGKSGRRSPRHTNYRLQHMLVQRVSVLTRPYIVFQSNTKAIPVTVRGGP
jgi:hypothetical protein